MSGIVTLTTDLGLTDEYVGVMKGVILSRAPGTTVVDLSHAISAQDIRQAGLCLLASYRFFPADTIHVAVVDPGVGSGRRIILCRIGTHFFLAPDNGLLSVMFDEEGFGEVRAVTCEDYFLSPVSHTFHGRDIFAPVAAALVAGLDPALVGPVIDREDLIDFSWPDVEIDTQVGIIQGVVSWVDHFGNLVTNIHHDAWLSLDLPKDSNEVRVMVGESVISGLARFYADVTPGEILVFFGSRGYLEIAVNRGSASGRLGTEVGDSVTLSVLR